MAALIAGPPFGNAQAVIIEAGDGTGNVTAPADDPGWANVGTRGSLSAVYLGRRWVLTANHVGAGDVVLDGQVFSAVPDSEFQFENPDTSEADLMVFKVFGTPDLPRLEILSSIPVVGDSITAIGHGRNRGAPTVYMDMGGYFWGVGNEMRWGTNLISDINLLVETTYSSMTNTTVSYAAVFTDPIDPSATVDEAAAATGDSGGGVFVKIGSNWYLAGTMIAIYQHPGQPPSTSIYDNKFYAADLSFYRDDILAVIEQKSCSDGLDDDGDGFTDFPDDPECAHANDDSESIPGVPTLGLPGLTVLTALMLIGFVARSRLRRRAI